MMNEYILIGIIGPTEFGMMESSVRRSNCDVHVTCKPVMPNLQLVGAGERSEEERRPRPARTGAAHGLRHDARGARGRRAAHDVRARRHVTLYTSHSTMTHHMMSSRVTGRGEEGRRAAHDVRRRHVTFDMSHITVPHQMLAVSWGNPTRCIRIVPLLHDAERSSHGRYGCEYWLADGRRGRRW